LINRRLLRHKQLRPNHVAHAICYEKLRMLGQQECTLSQSLKTYH
jgi:hypothetical protein